MTGVNYPVEFALLREEDLPMTVEAISVESGEVVWMEVVDKPGALIVPALHQQFGKVFIRVTYADGAVYDGCNESD